MADTTIVPIPISGGMDQSVSRFLGQPRLTMVNRARFVQPGELVASPSYSFVNSTFPTSVRRLRAVGSSLYYGLWAAYTGTTGPATGFTGVLSKPDQFGSWVNDSTLISPCEAPRRISLGAQSTSLDVLNGDVPIDVQLVPTDDCSLVLAITNGTSVMYVRNGVVAKQKAFSYSGGGQGLSLIAAGRSVVDSQGSIYLYTSSGDTWAKRYSETGTSVIVSASPNFGKPNTIGLFIDHLARLDAAGDIHVYSWDGANMVKTGVISHTDLPTGFVVGDNRSTMLALGVNVVTNSLIVLSAVTNTPHTDLWVKTYNITTLAATSALTQITYTGVGIDAGLNTVNPPFGTTTDSNGNTFFVFNGTRVSSPPGLLTACVYLFLLAGGSPTLNLVTYAIGHQTTGQMTPAPSVNTGCLFVTVDSVYELWLANNVNVSAQLYGAPTLCTTWGHGEVLQATPNAPIAQLVYGAVHSDVTGLQTSQLMIPARGLANAQTGVSSQGQLFWIPNSSVFTDEIVTVQLGETWPTNTIRGFAPYSGVAAPSSGISAPDLYQVAGDSIACGAPFELGTVVDSSGIIGDIPAPHLSLAGVSGLLSPGTYQYCLVLETTDSRGNIRRSAPSAIVSIVAGANNAVDLMFDTTPPAIPGLGKARYHIYRTLANGTVFHNVSNGVYVSESFPAYAYTDKLDDASCATRRILYSQGGTGGLSGQKPNYGMPACRCAWRGRDRTIVGGLEHTRRVRWSKLFQAGEALSFPHASEPGWYLDVDDDVMAVAQLDDAWLVLCQNGIFAVYGVGPNDDGSGGQFEPPRRISNMIGCHNWRSLLELPEGLLFQSQDGGIYLIVRGTLQIIWFSEKVRDTLGDVLTGNAVAWVTAAIAHDTKNTIHFVRDTGAPVVYDRRIQAWSIDGDGVTPGLIGGCCGCSGFIGANVVTQANASDIFPTVFIGTEHNGILFELCGNGAESSPLLGPSGQPWKALVETNDMALWGLGGWGQIPRVALTIGAPAAGTFPLSTTITVSQWATRDIGGTPLVSSVVPTFSDTNDGRLVPIEPLSQKCSSYRIRIEWSTGETIVGLTLEADGKPRLERTPSAGRN